MRKWYNFETRFISLRDDLRDFLKESGIKYELSGAFSHYHFEIFCNSAELEKVNNWLDKNTITEVSA